MKTIQKVSGLVLMALSLTCCSGDNDGGGSSGEPLVGQWKTISETENGIPQTLTECDLTEVSEFLQNGIVNMEDYDLENGVCVLNETPAEANLVLKWEKLSTDNYKITVYTNNVEAFHFDVATVFSDNNNTLTTTSTEPDGDVVVAVLNRIP